MIQHSIITQVEVQSQHIRITLDAVLESNIHCFINFPNSDAGSAEIINAYKEYSAKFPENFTLFQNLDRNNYINLLREGSFLIGNSSSGIVEVASLGLSAINVGNRQRGRIHGNNVIFVDNDKKQIKDAIFKALNDEGFKAKVAEKVNPYGDGQSTEKIIEVLRNIKLDENLVHKNITY
jgi:GDP/UDP-N,N'-diacetylbacillosamine 2-epimerase (hydrolysing)